MPGLSAALTDRGSLPHGFPLFLEYLFSTDNMQLGLKTFFSNQPNPAQTGLFWGAEEFISIHLPSSFHSHKFCYFVFFGGWWCNR